MVCICEIALVLVDDHAKQEAGWKKASAEKKKRVINQHQINEQIISACSFILFVVYLLGIRASFGVN